MHCLGSLVPNPLVVVTIIEKVFHCLLLLLEEGVDWWAYKSPFYEVVPGEDAVLYCETEKYWNFRPEGGVPNSARDSLLSMMLVVPLNMIGFLDWEVACCGVPPSKNVRTIPELGFSYGLHRLAMPRGPLPLRVKVPIFLFSIASKSCSCLLFSIYIWPIRRLPALVLVWGS